MTTNTTPKCACGCGDTIAKGKVWLPGHDARAKGRAARAAVAGDGGKAIAALPSPALRSAAEGLAAKWTAEATAKATRAAERAARAAAK